MNTQHHNRLRGFTLAELMIVVSIIAILISLLLPSLTAAKSAARTAMCASNMRQLFIGIRTATVDSRLKDKAPFTAATWVAQVAPYVEGGPAVTVCPEDDVTQDSAGGGDYSLSVWGWAKSWWNGAAVQGWDGKFQFAEGPRSKIHQAGETIPRTGGYTVPDLPNGYVIQFEDWDVNKSGLNGTGTPDLILEVTQSAGEMTIKVVFSSTAGNFAVLDPDDNPVWTGLKQKVGQSFSFPGGAASSYGVNDVIDQAQLASGKLLMVDYEKSLVSVAGAAATDDWNDYIDPDTNRHTFARHNGKMNAMYTDGSLFLTAVSEIDPDTADALQTYWQPPGTE
jgi:prepilin-type N-terminal cleavage/methylation domain-containing protein/prepilin-type processing-associated H-X9-DG protein